MAGVSGGRLDEFGRASVARLATVRPDGRPHLVPITFAIESGDVVTAVDHKPKRTSRLQRLVNIGANPAVALLVDHYEDDWDRLWWIRVDGTAAIHRADPPAVDALVAKYGRYRAQPPAGPVIRIAVSAVTRWAARP